MLITCPKCGTTYDIPPITDNPEQKVRCVKCAHVWEAAGDTFDPFSIDLSSLVPQLPESFGASLNSRQEAPVPNFQDFFTEPVNSKADYSKWIRPLYFISLFFIAISIYLFFFHPAKRAPVTLQTISYELKEKDYKTFLFLQAAAFNNTDKEIRPQAFTVLFADKNNRTLTTTTIDSPIEVLKANSVEKIDIEIERPPAKTEKVILTLSKMTLN